ncbi:MAG TPA: DinB family protein [Bryobacteraceae bacterium]|nr:DinB family protein [Bryobacteraceae bacterium]
METKRLASQLRRSYEGQAWHGPSLQELLRDVTAEQASAKPIPGAHSIFELVLHITAWAREALAVVEGKKYETLKGEADWPSAGGTWQAALDDLGSVTKGLVAAVREMPDEKLNEPAGGAEYNFYFLLHGLTQHNLYHAGQIAILKRAL